MQKMEVAVLVAAACDFDSASAVVVEVAHETRARGGVLRPGRVRVIRAAISRTNNLCDLMGRPARSHLVICTITADQGSTGFEYLPHAGRRETEGKVMAIARAFRLTLTYR